MITAGVIGGGVGSISGQVFSLQGLLFGSFFWAFVVGVRLSLGGRLCFGFRCAAGRYRLWHRVVAATAPRMATCNALYGEPSALEEPIATQRFERVLRTGRREATRCGREGRDAELVEAHKHNEWQSERTPTNPAQRVPELV